MSSPHGDLLDKVAPLLGYAGATLALGLSTWGAAVGTYKASERISALSAVHNSLTARSLAPVVVAGVLGIYGLIMAVVIVTSVSARECPVKPPRQT